MIEHTLLKSETTRQDIENLCAEAKQYKFACVCVNPSYVKFCAQLLSDVDVKICSVIGFPLGATSSVAKACETEQAIKDGAREVDMVINVGMLKSGEYDYVKQDILAVVNIAHYFKALTKVIIETGLLTEDEKIKACEIVKNSGADFVKGGATIDDIMLICKVVGPKIGIKASGGISTQEQALALIACGATRIGASASVKIVAGENASFTPIY